MSISLISTKTTNHSYTEATAEKHLPFVRCSDTKNCKQHSNSHNSKILLVLSNKSSNRNQVVQCKERLSWGKIIMWQVLGLSSPAHKMQPVFLMLILPIFILIVYFKKLTPLQSLPGWQPWRSQQHHHCGGTVPHCVSEEGAGHAKRLTRLSYTRTLKCPQCVFNMLRCGFTLDEGLHGGD